MSNATKNTRLIVLANQFNIKVIRFASRPLKSQIRTSTHVQKIEALLSGIDRPNKSNSLVWAKISIIIEAIFYV
jgi:hypothetical protein